MRPVLLLLTLIVGLALSAPAQVLAAPNDPEAYLANDDEMSRFGYWHNRQFDQWTNSIDVRFRGRMYQSAVNPTALGLAVSLDATDALAYAVYSSVLSQLNADGWLVTGAPPGSLPRNENLVTGYRTTMDGSESLIAVHRIGRVVGLTMLGGPLGSVNSNTLVAAHSYFVARARS